MLFTDTYKNLLKVEGLKSEENCGKENFVILQNALNECIAKDLSGLALPKGTFEVYNDKALYLYECLLNGTIHTLDNERWKKEKNFIFDVDSVDDFIICGNSTILEMRGMIEPFRFTNCKNITVENLSIDWLNTFYFSGDVVNKNGDTTYVVPHKGYKVRGEEPIVSINSVDFNTGRQGGMALFEKISNIKNEGNGVFSFDCAEPEYTYIGQTLVLRYLYSFAPVFLYYQCKNIKLNNVNVSAVPGMAVVAQKCENLHFDKLTVTYSKGRLMSANCDATHLINCYGKIVYDNCFFEGMGDDAANIHGFYLTVMDIQEDKIYIKHDSSTQNIYPYVPEKGNEIEFVNERNLSKIRSDKILDLVYDESKEMHYIKIEGNITSDIHPNTLIACTSEMPELVFNNCAVRNIRGRGLLIQTRNVTVKNCYFDGCTGQALHIDTAYGWGESIGVRNVEISNNKFIDCGFGSTKYCDAVAVVVETEADEEAVGVHKGIVIKDNVVLGDNNAFSLASCKDVVIENNHCIKCKQIIPQSSTEDIIIKDNNYC